MTTKKLFDGYFADNPKHERKTRSQVDRPEVYAFEEKIGKQLIEMNDEELLDMIATFRSNNFNDNYYSVYGSYPQISSIYKRVFEWYCRHEKPIVNPWNQRNMRGSAGVNRLIERCDSVLTLDYVNELIDKLHNDCTEERANYVECIVRMFLNGVYESSQIVNMKEDDIDFDKKTIRLSGTGAIITMDDRCAKLLQLVSKMTTIPSVRQSIFMVTWHGNYFKYPMRWPERTDDYDNVYIGRIINKQINEFISRPYKADINAVKLFYLGFYLHLVDVYGKDEANRYILAYRDSDANAKLEIEARVYGVPTTSLTSIRRSLRPYFKSQDRPV